MSFTNENDLSLRLQLQDELVKEEGLRMELYKDSEGYWTIGVGRLLEPGRGGISREEAMYLLRNDMAKKWADLDRELTWWNALDESRRIALFQMCYQMGIGRRKTPTQKGTGLLGFANTLEHIRKAEWKEAAEGIRSSAWYSQTPQRAERMAQRIEGKL